VSRVYLSLGSNLGNRAEHLAAGVATLERLGTVATSLVYETDPVGGVPQDDFYNVVVALDTDAAPLTVLATCQEAEQQRARVREVHWGPRTLDCDIVWFEDVTMASEQLTIPHPRAFERAFVLVPWRTLAPSLVSEQDIARAEGHVREVGTLESLL
jgi:2-amino-4-hydroxy-6-hydroxymethyldihydropteridine diphosphokinase